MLLKDCPSSFSSCRYLCTPHIRFTKPLSATMTPFLSVLWWLISSQRYDDPLPFSATMTPLPLNVTMILFRLELYIPGFPLKWPIFLFQNSLSRPENRNLKCKVDFLAEKKSYGKCFVSLTLMEATRSRLRKHVPSCETSSLLTKKYGIWWDFMTPIRTGFCSTTSLCTSGTLVVAEHHQHSERASGVAP